MTWRCQECTCAFRKFPSGECAQCGALEPELDAWMVKEQEMNQMNLRDWTTTVHEVAKLKGWWQGFSPERLKEFLPEKLCLIHSEVSEALELYREGLVEEGPMYAANGLVSKFQYAEEDTKREKPWKPVGFDSELADIIIRVMDLAGFLGIDLERAVREKNEHNRTRAHRHGGKKA